MKHLQAVVLLLALALVAASSAADEPNFKVRGRSLATVYLDAGRTDGLKAGDRLHVVTGETMVAEIEIVALSDHAASCRVLSLTRPIRTGDVVVLAVGKPVPAARSAPGGAAPGPASTPRVDGPNGTAPAASGATAVKPTTTASEVAAARSAPAAEKAPAAAPSPARTVASPASDPKPQPEPGPPTKTPADGLTPVGTPPGFGPAPAELAPPRPVASPALDPKLEPPAKRPADGPTPVGTPPGFYSTPPASATREPGAEAAPPRATPDIGPTPVAAAKPAPAAAAAKPSTAPGPGSEAAKPSTVSTPAAASAGVSATAPAPSEVDADGAPTVVARPASETRTASAAPTPDPPDPPSAAPSTVPASSWASAPAGTRVAALSPPPSSSPAPAPPSGATASPASALLSGRGFRVKYRSATSVYLEGGRAQGLIVGDQLRVRAGQTTVAELEVIYVAELSASCKVLTESRPVHAGDEAFAVARPGRALGSPGDGATTPTDTASLSAASPAAPAVGTPLLGSRRVRAWARVRGSASFGYYRTWDQTESALDFEQRTARLDLGLDDIAGEPLSFTLRARSRQDIRARTLSTRTPADERVDRLYELALRYEPPSDQLALEVGRIGLYRFVGIGYLDGALARFQPRPGLQVGAFGGRQADIEGLGLEGMGGKYGAFVQLAPGGRYSMGGYDVLLAYVRENAEGDVSREYVSLESSLTGGSRWSLFQRAELDLNRGWRQEITGTSRQLSNISLSGNLRLGGTSWAFVSYDGRRNYRYYRNRLVPEEIFDDLLHQGLRAGLTLARPGGFGASAGFGMNLKESDPRHPELDLANAYSFNFGLRHSNLFSSGVSAGVDGSGFTNGYAEGGLLSAHLGWRFGPGHLLDFSYGYSLYSVTQTEEDRTTQWLRFMGRAELGRRFYLLGDFEYDAGDDLEGPRGFLELGVFF